MPALVYSISTQVFRHPCIVHRPISSSERIILWRYLVREEAVEDRNLLHDVVAHLGDLGEEEEGEEAGYTAESGCENAAKNVLERAGEEGIVARVVDKKDMGDALLCCSADGNAVVVLRNGVSVVLLASGGFPTAVCRSACVRVRPLLESVSQVCCRPMPLSSLLQSVILTCSSFLFSHGPVSSF